MIRRFRNSLLALVMALFFIAVPVLQTQACAPDFTFAVIINLSHPDQPFKFFAAGNIGVVQPAWAKSYLCVAYRYLTNDPLTKVEQQSVVRLWQTRLKTGYSFSDPAQVDNLFDYLAMRNKALGVVERDTPSLYWAVDRYRYADGVGNDAFVVATKTLAGLIKRYGAKSRQVREWVKAQDIVFAVDLAKKKKAGYVSDEDNELKKMSSAQRLARVTADLPPLGNSFDALMRADRQYQIAAATFYAKSFGKAAELFSQIASDKNSPWHDWAAYLVARAKADSMLTASADSATGEDAIAYIKNALKTTHDFRTRQDLLDLLGPLEYMSIDPNQRLANLVQSITKTHSERFGANVGDLTFTMDVPNEGASEQAIATHDLTDWISTIQQQDNDWRYYSDDEKKAAADRQKKSSDHAVAQWRKTHSLPWLIAAISLNGLRSPELKDLYQATAALPPSSPAYLTASFFVNDALIFQGNKQGNKAAAKARLMPILGRKNLPPSTDNLFKAQLCALSTSPIAYVRAAVINPPEDTDQGMLLPKDWMKRESANHFTSDAPTFDTLSAEDFNRNLPFSLWMKLSQDKAMPPALRARIIRSTWVRGQLLGKAEQTDQLLPAFAAAYPVCANLIHEYQDAPSGEAKRYAAARLMLMKVGMTPYVQAGVERHGNAIGEFDYYNANYWQPIPLKKPAPGSDEEDGTYWYSVWPDGGNLIATRMQDCYKPGIARLLSANERADAHREMVALWNNPLPKFAGPAILAWANSHPNDPTVPEMLFRLVKIPKWSGVTAIGSNYSHKAYNLLHSRYGRTKWAAKAVCWY